jgi:hypothetical protein
LNPSNTTIKENKFVIVVQDKDQERLLKQALVGMKNVKWIDILFSRNKGEESMSRIGDLLIGMQEDAECVSASCQFV